MKYHPVVVCFNRFMVSSSKVNYALENFDHKVGLQKSPLSPSKLRKNPNFYPKLREKDEHRTKYLMKNFSSVATPGAS